MLLDSYQTPPEAFLPLRIEVHGKELIHSLKLGCHVLARHLRLISVDHLSKIYISDWTCSAFLFR